jgi:hypothetical protein
MVVARVPAFRRNTTRRVPHATGSGFSQQPDEPIYADIEITLDVEQLLRQLAPKAVDSKAKRSTAANGAIVVRALNSRSKP